MVRRRPCREEDLELGVTIDGLRGAWRARARSSVQLPKETRVIPFIVAFGFLLEGLDSTCITTAIPDMAVSLSVSPISLNLAITAYVLSLAVFIPISGWIADRFGSRRVFCAAIVVFTIGSAACGFANSLPVLVATRALQGLGGAMMTPVGRLILLRTFSRQHLVVAMAYMSIPSLIGPTLGPIVGGLLTTYLSWRWIFFVNLPVGVLGVILTLRYVRDVGASSRTRFDVVGFLICGAALAMLEFSIENAGRQAVAAPVVAAVFTAACLCLVAYVRYARRHKDPVLDLSLMRIRTFRIANLAGGFSRISLNASPFLLPLLLQVGFGLSPIASGMITFASSIGAFTVKPVSAALLRALGFSRLLSATAVLSALTTAGFAMFSPSTSHWLLLPYVMAFGVIRTTQFTSINGLGYSEIPPEQLSRSVSLGSVAQQVSNGFGVSLSAALLGLIVAPGQPLSVGDFRIAFIAMGAVALIALPGYLLLKPSDGAQVSGRRLPRATAA